jgi:hypothetical protein
LSGCDPKAITVLGDGSTDLDLHLIDKNGHVAACDESDSGDCRVLHTPLWSGPFLVKVVNRGSVSNLYFIVLD